MNKYIILADFLETYLFGEDLALAKRLESDGWILRYYKDTDVEHVRQNSSVVLCIPYGRFPSSIFKSKTNKIIYKSDDLLPYPHYQAEDFLHADIVLSTYAYLIKDIPSLAQYTDKVVFFPHFAIEDIFDSIEVNSAPIKKILVSGATTPEYPFRKKMASLNGHGIDTLIHPGYGTSEEKLHDVIGKKYYEYLNRYIACFSDASSYRYILAKSFEILSSGSLLLVEEPVENELSKIGLIDMQNCIVCTEDNVISKIKWILDPANERIVDRIRFAGKQLVSERHTVAARAALVESLVKSP